MHWLYLYQHITSSLAAYFTGVFDRQQRREKSNIFWQTWVGGMLTIAPVMLIWARPATAPWFRRAVFCCDCLCWAVWPTIWTSVPLSFRKLAALGVPSREKQSESPASGATSCWLGLQPGLESQTWQLRSCDVWNAAHKGARSICMHPT